MVRSHHGCRVDPDRLWAAAEGDALAEASRGMVAQSGLPGGRLRSGRKRAIEVSGFGVMPRQPHEILERDAARTMTGRDRGAGIRAWNHRLWAEVRPEGEGCRLRDRIEIDAGPTAPAVAVSARALRRRRPRRRMRMPGLAGRA